MAVPVSGSMSVIKIRVRRRGRNLKMGPADISGLEGQLDVPVHIDAVFRMTKIGNKNERMYKLRFNQSPVSSSI